jgi:hypothetical protein
MTELTKPEVEFPDGPAPTELVIEDLVVGEGAEAQAGGTVNVHYLGVDYESGDEFDSSWSRGQSIEFPLAMLGAPGTRVWRGGPGPPPFGSHPHLHHRPARRQVTNALPC